MTSRSEFATKRLQLAVFLHAAGLLTFIRVEPNGDGKVRFVFEDAAHQGSHHELAFERGAEVCARDLFSSQTFLRRAMSDEQNENRKTGESQNELLPSN